MNTFNDCCDDTNLVEIIEDQLFEFLIKKILYSVTIKVPVITCTACGMQYTDSRAEKIREDAYNKVFFSDATINK